MCSEETQNLRQPTLRRPSTSPHRVSALPKEAVPGQVEAESITDPFRPSSHVQRTPPAKVKLPRTSPEVDARQTPGAYPPSPIPVIDATSAQLAHKDPHTVHLSVPVLDPPLINSQKLRILKEGSASVPEAEEALKLKELHDRHNILREERNLPTERTPAPLRYLSTKHYPKTPTPLSRSYRPVLESDSEDEPSKAQQSPTTSPMSKFWAPEAMPSIPYPS